MPVTIQYYNDVLTDTAAILANLMQWRKKLEEKKLPGVFMQEFIQRYHVEEQKEDLLKAGEALDRLYIAVEEAAKDLPQSRLEAYFTPLASGQISVGEALARLIGLKLTPNDFPPEQRPQISIKTAAHILPQNDTPGWDDYPDYDSFLDALSHSDFAPEVKWMAADLARRTQEIEDEVLSILERPASAYREIMPELKPWFDRSFEAMKQKVEANPNDPFGEGWFLMQDTPDENRTFLICPSAASWNGMGMWMTSLKPGATALLYVGCLCFDLMDLLQDGDTLLTLHLSDAAKALDDRQRLKILLALREGSLCGSELSERLGLSAATISHHMNLLLQAGLISVEKVGNRLQYSLRPQGCEQMVKDLQSLFGL